MTGFDIPIAGRPLEAVLAPDQGPESYDVDREVVRDIVKAGAAARVAAGADPIEEAGKVNKLATDLSPSAVIGTNAHGGKSTVLAARFDLLDATAMRDLGYQAGAFHQDSKTSPSYYVDKAISDAYLSLDCISDDDDTEGARLMLIATQFHAYQALALDLGAAHDHGLALAKLAPSECAYRFSALYVPAIFHLAEVVGYGAAKYTINNWRAVPVNEHLNHALVHLFAYLSGDTQDDHLGHAFCRSHMALAVYYQGAPWVVIDKVPQPDAKAA